MMLALKLTLTPLLITAATLAGRRWGAGISGWLVGLPLTSGPVSFFLALQYGPAFAAQAAIGILGGLAAVAAFCLAYALTARHARWPVSTANGSLAFVLTTLALNQFTLQWLATFFIAIAAMLAAYWLMPPHTTTHTSAAPPRWDIPARILVATLLVVSVTTLASTLGPQLSGLITPFPVFTLVLAAFAHRRQGPDAAIHILSGVMIGTLGAACFFLIVSTLLVALGLAITYLLALLAILLINGLSLRWVQP